jgi:hypothetical protein
MPEEYFHLYSARLSAIEAVTSLARGEADVAPRIAQAASLLRDAAKHIDEEPVSRAYEDLGAMLEGVAHVANWGRAVRAAEADADRFLRAAKQAGRDLRKKIEERSQGLSPVLPGLDVLGKITELEEVEQLARQCLCIALPLPRTTTASGRTLPRTAVPATESSGESNPAVAFLLFSFRSAPLSEPWIVTPNMLYDLLLEVKLSRWPAGATRIEFAPLHVEAGGIIEAPSFELRPPSVPTDLTFHPVGRLRISVPQDFLARPLEIHYTAFVERASPQGIKISSTEMIVQGHRRIVLQSFDPALNPVSGVREVDERLLFLRSEARKHGIPDEELGHFLVLLAGTGNLAFQAVASNLYRGGWPEQRFQDDAKSRLRAFPAIGSKLEEHPHAAGGITDLSFHQVRLELKSDDKSAVTVDSAVAQYGQQTAQYVAGSDRRCGVLMVLDMSTKSTAPGSIQNDIGLRVVRPPSGQGGREIVLGVVIVRGNLARPSDLSK